MVRPRLLTVFALLAGALLGPATALAGDWLPARAVGTGSGGARGDAVQVAIDGQGNVLAVWRRCAGDPVTTATTCGVFAADHPAGRDWAAPHSFGPTGSVGALQLTVGPAGEAALLWSIPGSGLVALQAAVRPPGGDWEPATALPSPFPGAYFNVQSVTFDAAGNTTVLATLGSIYTPSVAWLMAIRHPAGGSWQPAQLIATDPAPASPAAGAGSVAAEADLYGGGVSVRGRGPDGALGPPVDLWTPVVTDVNHPWGRNPTAASGTGGHAVVAWQVLDNAEDFFVFRSGVLASLRGPDGTWAAAESLTGGLRDPLVSPPSAVVDASGDSAVIWSGSDGRVEVALHDPLPPTLTGLTVSADAHPGTALAFAVDARDGFTGLAGPPRWSFGDGGSAVGDRVQHVFARAGAYTVAVEAADLAGNPARAERRVVVIAPAPSARPPRAVTGSARLLCGRRALLTGAVTANGLRTGARFTFGVRTLSRATPARPQGSGWAAHPVRAIVAGLRPGTTYRLRLVAQSAAGTALGRVALLRVPRAALRPCASR